MEPNPEQPKNDVKANVAKLAKVHRLQPFDDLDLIDKYAARFGLDPDRVYYDTSFGTIINFMTKWKEQDEFQERFNFIWHEIHTVPNPT